MLEGRLPTVPEYYAEHIERSVDLTVAPKQCCPFHKENTPSFSYNLRTGRWTCFGQCHASGDVIDMHKRFQHLSSREEAQRSLESMYRVEHESIDKMEKKEIYIPQSKVEDEACYLEACRLANTTERWLELDYVMSQYPFERIAVQGLINQWKGLVL